MFVFVALSFTCVTAQTRRETSETDFPGDKDRVSQGTVMVQPRGPALESVINPANYFVGPSDGFSVNIWSSKPLAFELTVTPEGTLIIPTVGEVQVSQMTLAAAKEKVAAAVRKRYLESELTMTLVNPRPIVVTVEGEVLNTGSYTMAAYNRVDKVLEAANKLMPGEAQSELDNIKFLMSTRRIILRHNDRTQSRVDLQRFLALKEDRWNPYLREGDVVVVPPYDVHRNVIGVYGQVNAPGRFEFADGDSVSDAIRFAFGFSPGAREDSVELTRQDRTGYIRERTSIDARGILAGTVPDIPLQPGDRILVRGTVDQRGDYRVKITGEVLFPGLYPITRDSTRLSELVRSAGGFSDDALLSSAEVLRQPVRESDVETERLMSIRGGVPPDDTTDFYIETTLRMRKEQVTTDFVKLFVRGDQSSDVFLQSGDEVIIPSRKKTVYVFGQVVSPGHVPFIAGEDVWRYIERAGGVTDRSRRGDIKVIKARSRQWLNPGDTSVEEGDFIWVPKVPDHPFGYYLGIIAQSATVLSVAISIVLLVNQYKK
jgi:protein involved in polysaccharide export with SLBB domain